MGLKKKSKTDNLVIVSCLVVIVVFAFIYWEVWRILQAFLGLIEKAVFAL